MAYALYLEIISLLLARSPYFQSFVSRLHLFSLYRHTLLNCVGDKSSVDDVRPPIGETDTVQTRYEQTLRERDEAQRAYTLARHEVDALLHSLSEMKAERDQAVANYRNVLRTPASTTPDTAGVIG